PARSGCSARAASRRAASSTTRSRSRRRVRSRSSSSSSRNSSPPPRPNALEPAPEQLPAAITDRLRIPTIGIGAGAGYSGQVQVITDLLGIETWHPKHSKPYADLRGTILAAAKAYADDVTAGTFPGPDQTVRMADDVLDEVL